MLEKGEAQNDRKWFADLFSKEKSTLLTVLENKLIYSECILLDSVWTPQNRYVIENVEFDQIFDILEIYHKEKLNFSKEDSDWDLIFHKLNNSIFTLSKKDGDIVDALVVKIEKYIYDNEIKPLPTGRDLKPLIVD